MFCPTEAANTAAMGHSNDFGTDGAKKLGTILSKYDGRKVVTQRNKETRYAR